MSPLLIPGDDTEATVERAQREDDSLILAFDDNRLLSSLFGKNDEYLVLIEDRLGIEITPRGNRLAIRGSQEARERARTVLADLHERLRRGQEVGSGEVEGAIRLQRSRAGSAHAPADVHIRTRRKVVSPRSPMQASYIHALQTRDVVLGTGPAGTGKTYLAVACAAAALAAGSVERMILSRPAVEAGERLGFLPGDMKEKVDPYLRPLYDALYDVLPASQVARHLADGTIEIAPLAFMRGRTLASAFIILDEAQNTTPQQMKMFLTRLGEGSRMVANGDPTQVDLPPDTRSGLAEAVALLSGIEGIAHVAFTAADIVRHPLVGRIVTAYEAAERSAKPRGKGSR